MTQPCFDKPTTDRQMHEQPGFGVVLSQTGNQRFTFISAGFQITFSHCTVSVQFGNRNYCDNRYSLESVDGCAFCANAEVAVFDCQGFVDGWPHSSTHDRVVGGLTSDQVADVIAWAKNYKPRLSVVQDEIAQPPPA